VKCKKIVCLVLRDKPYLSDGPVVDELNKCDELLKLRYGEANYVSDQIVVLPLSTVGNNLEFSNIRKSPDLIKISAEWVNGGKQHADGLGLYIQTHGTAQAGPIVTAKNMATIVAQLYDLGLRFRKINLAWCCSAVQPKESPYGSVDNGFDFVKRLAFLLKNGDSLDKTLFSAYILPVTFHQFENDTKPVRNAFMERSINKITHPSGKKSEDAAAKFEEKFKEKKPGKARDQLSFQTFDYINGIFKIHDQASYDTLTIAINYFINKKFWRVNGEKVEAVDAEAYTDSEDIRFLHSFIYKGWKPVATQ